MHITRICLSLLVMAGGALMAEEDQNVPENMVPKLAKVTPAMLGKITAACPTEAPAKPLKPRKLLIFSRCEGFVHGAISVGNKAFIILGERSKAYTADVSYDYAMFDEAKLAAYDAILLNSTTDLKIPEGAPRKALMDFVRNGKGIIGVHAGVDNFKNFPEAKAMMGGIFAGHPWTAKGTWRFKVEEPDHVLTKCFDPKGFFMKDECYQYDQKITNRNNIRYLVSMDLSDPKTAAATTEIDDKNNKPKGIRTDGDNPVIWVRSEGKGRVFHTGFGHNNDIFWEPTILLNFLAGIQYAMGDLKADDAIVPKK